MFQIAFLAVNGIAVLLRWFWNWLACPSLCFKFHLYAHIRFNSISPMGFSLWSAAVVQLEYSCIGQVMLGNGEYCLAKLSLTVLHSSVCIILLLNLYLSTILTKTKLHSTSHCLRYNFHTWPTFSTLGLHYVPKDQLNPMDGSYVKIILKKNDGN